MRRTELPHCGVLTRLGVSRIHGVGVFALMAIAAETLLFARDEANVRWIDPADLEASGLTSVERALYRDFAIRRDGKLGCPTSFDLLTPGWFINQAPDGETANVTARHDFALITVRDISLGEELTLDYDEMRTGPPWD